MLKNNTDWLARPKDLPFVSRNYVVQETLRYCISLKRVVSVEMGAPDSVWSFMMRRKKKCSDKGERGVYIGDWLCGMRESDGNVRKHLLQHYERAKAPRKTEQTSREAW